MEKRSSRIGTMSSKQFDVKNQLCLDVYCSVQPRPLAIDFDSGLVDRNPLRRCLRRVVTAVSQSIYSLPNSLMRPFNAEISKNLFCFSERISGRVELDSERPNGRRCPLTLPSFF